MEFRDFERLLYSSKRYEFLEDGKLKLTNYYTGESVILDLSRIDEEMYEQILCEDDEDDAE